MRASSRRVLPWAALAVAVLAAAWAVAYARRAARGPSRAPVVSPAGLPALPDPGSSLLIMAPHPDDETLGCSGLIRQAVARGATVHVVVMTNGEGFRAERSLMAVEEMLEGTVAERLQLARKREHETLSALQACGVSRDHVFFLGYPGAGLPLLWQPGHWPLSRPWRSAAMLSSRNPFPSSFSRGAPYAGQQVLADLTAVMSRVRPTAVFTTPPYDIHPTHWATANFVLLALAQYNGQADRPVPLYWYLVHYPHWPVPWGYAPSQPLRPPHTWAHWPGLSWFAVSLTAEEVRHKTACLSRYATQGAAHSAELRSFLRANELFAQASLAPTAAPAAVRDPLRNLPADWLRPEEDIVQLRVAGEAGAGLLSLELAAPPDPSLYYTVVWHSLAVPGPSVASFAWHNGKGVVVLAAADGAVRPLPATCEVRGAELVTGLPADALIASPVTLDAFCRRGRHYANHTLTAVVSLPPPGAGEPAPPH